MHPLKCVWPIDINWQEANQNQCIISLLYQFVRKRTPDGPQLSDSIDIYGDSDISNLGPYSVYNYSVVENRPNCHICLVF